MQIVYLDQNQWIRLARALTRRGSDPKAEKMAAKLARSVATGKIVLPLTAANIYETYKINDPDRRHDLAIIQTQLSAGRVFVGRRARLVQNVSTFVRALNGASKVDPNEVWFLSGVFFEAFANVDDARLDFSVSDDLLGAIRADAGEFLFDFIVRASPNERRLAVQNWSQGSAKLRLSIENRRARMRSEPESVRRRAYSAMQLIDDLNDILEIARLAGANWNCVSDIGDKTARKLIREAPVFHVERELVLRIEAQDRPLEENDFRDMMSYCAAIPYADAVIGEKQFINLARQAGLHKYYGTLVSSELESLESITH